MHNLRIDHIVLTVNDIAASVDFYVNALGMTAVFFAGGRTALAFGDQKINLHEAGSEITPHAARPMPGAADLCLLTDTPLEVAVARLAHHEVAIELGPVERTGAVGPIRSVYFRDPDGNLVELGVVI